LKFFDFCSGIGGGRTALESVGLECVGFSEKDRDSALIYSYLTGDDRNAGDVMRIEPSRLPDFDIMLAGFPYKNFSSGGKRTGFADNRAHVITALIGILSEKNIPAFIFENDRGLLTHNGGKSFRTVVESLESSGYKVYHKVLNSSDYGIPHVRDRVYIVGIRRDRLAADFVWPQKLPAEDISEFLCDEDSVILPFSDSYFTESLVNEFNKGRIFIDDLIRKEYTIIDRRWADLRVFDGRVPALSSARTGVVYIRDGKMHKISGYEALLLQGFPKKTADRARAAGILKGRLMKYAANSVSVNVITEIAKNLISSISVSAENSNELLPTCECRGSFEGACGKKAIMKKLASFSDDENSKKWLSEIGHNPENVDFIETKSVSAGKTDIELYVREKGKRVVNIENIELIHFSSKSRNAKLSVGSAFDWDMPSEIAQLIEFYAKNEIKFTEMSEGEREMIRSWFYEHRFLVISDIVAGRGETSAEWALMTRKTVNETFWCLESVGTVIRRLSSGNVSFSGNTLKICGITLSRTAQSKLQFSANDIFIADS